MNLLLSTRWSSFITRALLVLIYSFVVFFFFGDKVSQRYILGAMLFISALAVIAPVARGKSGWSKFYNNVLIRGPFVLMFLFLLGSWIIIVPMVSIEAIEWLPSAIGLVLLFLILRSFPIVEFYTRALLVLFILTIMTLASAYAVEYYFSHVWNTGWFSFLDIIILKRFVFCILIWLFAPIVGYMLRHQKG